MRRCLFILLLLLGMTAPAFAAIPVSVRVSWAANPASDGVTSYKVYFGTGAQCGPGQSSVFGQVSSPLLTFTADISLNAPTTYLFCVTAIDGASNEGLPSDAVSKLLNPFWAESFEDTGLARWTQNPSGLGGTVTVSDTDKTDGIRSLRVTYADTTRVGGPFLDRATPTVSELFTRFYIRALPGFTWGSPHTTLGTFGAGTTAPIISLVNSPLTGGAPYLLAQTVKEASYGSESLLQNQGTPAIISSSWVCMETRLRYNTPGASNGIAQYWMDNILKGDYQNREFIGSLPSDAAPSTAQQSFVRLYNDRGQGTLFIDQLQISNQRLGCSGSTPPPASATVIAPTNLRFATGVSPSNIADDATSTSSTVVASNTTSWSHTVGAGSGRALLTTCQARDGSSSDTVISSMTFGAQAMTSLRTDSMSSGDPARTSWWGLVNPTTGSANIVPTFTGTVSKFNCYAISLTGVNQAAMLAGATGTVDTTSPSEVSTTIANSTSGAWAFDSVWNFNEYGMTVGAGQTMRDDRVPVGGSYLNAIGVSSVGPLPASVTQEMKWTLTPPAIDRNYVQSVILIAPEAGSGSTDVIQWDDNSTDETGFAGEWKHDGTAGVYVPIFLVGPNITTYPNPITTEVNVSIRVYALKNAEFSEYSNVLSTVPPTTDPPDPGGPIVVPPPDPTTPTTPTTPVPTPTGNLQNGLTILSWPSLNTTESTASQVIVEWSNYKTGAGLWKSIGTAAVGATGFVHRYTPFVPAGEPEAWACYRVKFKNGAGASAYSPESCHDIDVFVPLVTPSVQAPTAPSALYLQ